MERFINIIVANSGMISMVSLSIGLSFYWIKNAYYRRRKRLSYAIKPCPKTTLNDHANRSVILFWNWGKESVRFEDFTNQGVLRILSNHKIYSAEVVGTTDEYAQIVINPDENGFSVSPEYIEKDHGFILKVEHNDKADLVVEGKILGGCISQANGIKFWNPVNYVSHLFASLAIFVGYGLLCVWLFGYLSLSTNYNGSYDWIILPGLISIAMLAICLVASFDCHVLRIQKLLREHF